MQKIPTLFKREHEGDRLVYDEVASGTEWVIEGEGIATRKWDGTACMVQDGRLFKRYDCKKGRQPPEDFEPCEAEPDPVTGHWPGWVPVGDGPEDRWHREAWETWNEHVLFSPPDGTYELCGPKINANPEQFASHRLIRHGTHIYSWVPRSFDGLREWFKGADIEGLVWHHLDGRMAKLKKRDLGMSRGD